MADFPIYAVLLRDFSVQRGSAVERTAFEDGMVKQLRKVSRVLVARRVKYGLRTKADYQSFITWFEATIRGGADWFNWTDPVSETVKTARIVSRIDEEAPDDPMLAWWTLSFTIETWSS